VTATLQRNSRTSAKPLSGTAVGVLMVLLGGALFAVNGTASKLIMEAGVDAGHLTVLRASGAALGLLAVLAVRGRAGARDHSGARIRHVSSGTGPQDGAVRPRAAGASADDRLGASPGTPRPRGLAALRVSRRELPLLIGYGLVGFLAVPALYFVAIAHLPVGIALLFEYTAPLLVALWARFGQRQRVRPRLWFGLALSLAGLAAVAQVWHTGAGALDPVGVAAGLGAAALVAVYYVLGPRLVARREASAVTCWSFGVAALAGAVLWPWWRFPYHVLGQTSHGLPVWLLAGYLVVGGSIAAYSLNLAALRHLPPTSVGIVGMVEPVLASAVAWLVLDERLAGAQLAGGVFILAGVALAETARTVGPQVPAALPPT
jgi:drug/metabolite transporter (DMT)-like permease